MKKTRIISFLLAAVLLIFACCPGVFANTYEDLELNTNAANVIELKKGDTLIAHNVKLSGNITFVTTGYAKPTIVVSHSSKNILTGKTTTTTDATLKPTENGNIFDIVSMSSLVDYDITITQDSIVPKFELYVFKTNSKYSGFTAYPTASTKGSAPKTYYEDIDFTVGSETLLSASINFTNEPDFTGARFEFKDDNNACVFALENNDVKQILGTPTFASSIITYKSVLSGGILSGNTNSSITFKAQANPIKSVRIVGQPDPAPVYHFGKDGTIKGTLKSYYFRPDIKFDGITFKITFKDYVTQGNKNITTEYPVQKDGDGYYIEIDGFGKQRISYIAEVTENKTQPYDATVRVGSGNFKMTVNIEKANIFEFIGIWFRLLFGMYK